MDECTLDVDLAGSPGLIDGRGRLTSRDEHRLVVGEASRDLLVGDRIPVRQLGDELVGQHSRVVCGNTIPGRQRYLVATQGILRILGLDRSAELDAVQRDGRTFSEVEAASLADYLRTRVEARGA